jgi:hypothetical protein
VWGIAEEWLCSLRLKCLEIFNIDLQGSILAVAEY